MKARRVKIALMLILASLSISTCRKGEGVQKDGRQEHAKSVMVEVLSKASMADLLHYTADLLPYTEVKIYSPVADRILDFPWKNGDSIRRGQRLALVRKEGLDKGLEQIVAQIESLDVQIANLESELERSRGLLKAGVITRQAFDKIQASYLSSVAQRKALKASQGQLAVQAGNAVIKAPIHGVIAEKMLEKGDMAMPQLPLCRILQIDRLKVHLDLVESDLHKVKEGQKVRVRLDCCRQPFVGELVRVFPYLNRQTRTNTAEVILDNPYDEQSRNYKLKPGMFGTAEIVVEEKKEVLAVPERALLLDNQLLNQQKHGEVLRKAFVVDSQGVAKQRLVRLGSRQGSVYEALEGLVHGEKIVVRGQHGLKDGQRVEVVSQD